MITDIEELDRLLVVFAKAEKSVRPRGDDPAAQLQRLLVQKVPQIWLFASDLVHVTKKSVKGFQPHPSTFFQGLATTWLE